MKRSAFILLFLLTGSAASGQVTDNRLTQKQVVFVELLGNGIDYSINYERVLMNRDRFKSTLRGGAGWWGRTRLPITYNHLYSYGRHHLEMGLGVTTEFGNESGFLSDWDLYPVADAGYRFQKPGGRLVFRTVILFYTVFEPAPVSNVSIGISLGRAL